MKAFRLNNTEMIDFARKVMDFAGKPEYKLSCDPGSQRSIGDKVCQRLGVTIQQRPINQLLNCGKPPAPTFHFQFKIDHVKDVVSLNWDKVETTVYHLDGKHGMIIGEITEPLKEFLSGHIMRAMKRPHTVHRQRAAELSS